MQIPAEFKGKFDDWIFGCDICQQVCPWNRLSEPHNEPEFHPSEELMNLNKQGWECLTELNSGKYLKHLRLKRAKYKGMKRNIDFLRINY